MANNKSQPDPRTFGPPFSHISVRIPPAQAKALNDYAAREGVSRTDVVRNALGKLGISDSVEQDAAISQLDRMETKLDMLADHVSSMSPRGKFLAESFVTIGFGSSTPQSTQNNMAARAR